MSKVSVITINYNNSAGLEKTINSVLSQSSSEYEFIVIDGASTDGSVDLIKKNASRINYWVSEKDAGIYDALNKGVNKATGDYLIFLNSGDYFYDNKVVEAFGVFASSNNKKVIYGNSNFIEKDGTSRVVCPPAKLDLNFWYADTVNHQAIFFKRELFLKYGDFDIQYKYAADFDCLFKIYMKEPSEFVYWNQLVCHYDNTGLTSTYEVHKVLFKERKQIIQKFTSRQEFKEMRLAYFKTLSFSKKLQIIISENDFLKAVLKPIYQAYSSLLKR